MTQKKLNLKSIPVLNSDFFYGWHKNRDNPEYQKLIPEGTIAVSLRADRQGLSDEQVEADFRAVATDVLKAFVSPGHATVSWIWAAMEDRGMPCVLSHLENNLQSSRFHLFELKLDRGNRFGGWISILWDERWFSELMKDPKIIFDTGINTYGVVIAEEKIEKFLNMEGPIQAKDFSTLINEVECAIVFDHHMEGLYMISLKKSATELANAIVKTLPQTVSVIQSL